MGYLVESSGRLLLPEALEPQALTVLEVELLRHRGWFSQERVEEVDSLGDLARFAAATLTRDGDWLVVSTDEAGDPKWSEQAAAFYAGLARWVLRGEVHLHGEDGRQWSYRFTPEGMVQDGDDGWDGTPGAASTRGSQEPTPPAPPAPQPPLVLPPATAPPTWPDPPTGSDALRSEADVPARGGRTVAMTLLLIVGVILIIGLASLAAGMV